MYEYEILLSNRYLRLNMVFQCVIKEKLEASLVYYYLYILCFLALIVFKCLSISTSASKVFCELKNYSDLIIEIGSLNGRFLSQ